MSKHSLSTFSFNKKILIFCCKCILLPLIIALFFLILVLPEYSNHYVGALGDKVNYLKEIDEPKIVLVGNSNLAFGINSELIEEAFGMPVVNLGMHGGLGNAFHEETAKLNVHEGDIYVICHTDYNDNDTISDRELACITLENHIQLWGILRAKDIIPMLEVAPVYMQKSFKLWINQEGNKEDGGEYLRRYFNKYGDYALERKEQAIEFTEGMIVVPIVDHVCTDRLNKLNAYLTDRGAKMVIAAYAIPDCEFTPSKDEYQNFQLELQEALDAPVISDFTEYRMSQDLFFDTQYHLIDKGVDIRTQKLIDDLTKWCDESDR